MGKIRNRARQHLQSNWWVYLLVGLCFVAGIVFGSLGVNVLDEQQASALGKFVDQGLASFDDTLNYNRTTHQAMIKYLSSLGKIFVLGLTVIGFPLILVIVFTRGFVLGFTVVFLIQVQGIKGGGLSLLAILPPNLLSLPAYLLGAVAAINFSVYLLKGRDSARTATLGQYILGYVLVMGGLSLLMVGAAFIEGYLSPVMIQLLGF